MSQFTPRRVRIVIEEPRPGDLKMNVEFSDHADMTVPVIDAANALMAAIRTPLDQRPIGVERDAYFTKWADWFFFSLAEHANTFLPKQGLMISCRTYLGFALSPQAFMVKLTAWASARGFVLNPDRLRNTQGRIVRDFNGSTIEMIYLETPTMPETEKGGVS